MTREQASRILDVIDDILGSHGITAVTEDDRDEYRHVKKRLRSRGWASFYPGDAFQASPEQFAAVQALLDEYHDRHGIVFETCAEPALTGDAVLRTGCVSAVDLAEMGLPVPDAGTNPQGRGGCLCLSCKTELLTCRAQCPPRLPVLLLEVVASQANPPFPPAAPLPRKGRAVPADCSFKGKTARERKPS